MGTELQADQSAVRTGLIRDRYPFFALKRNEARVFRGSVMDYSKTPENLRPKQTYAAMSLAPLIVSSIAHVGAGAERPTAARQDDHAYRRVRLGPIHAPVELCRQPAAPRVQPLGPVERHHGHPAVTRVVEHQTLLIGSGQCANLTCSNTAST